MSRSPHVLVPSLLALLVSACGGSSGGNTSSTPQQLDLSPVASFTRTITQSGSVLAAAGITVGDAAVSAVSDEEHRGFMRFTATPQQLPSGVTIVAATLRFSQTDVTGDPYNNLGDLLIDNLVDLGGDIDPADFDAGPNFFADRVASTTGTLEEKQVDVSDAVSGQLANGLRDFDFRFRFEAPTNDDGADDLATLADPGNLPVGATAATLVIVFTE